MNNPVRVAMVQDNFLVGDIKGNADKLIQQAQTAAKNGADLVVFPELALVGYPPEDLLHRPGFIAQAKTELKRIQKETQEVDVVLVGGKAATLGELHQMLEATTHFGHATRRSASSGVLQGIGGAYTDMGDVTQ